MTPTLIALGGGDSLWDDFNAARDMVGDYHVAAINDAIGAYRGDIEFAASLHPEKMGAWLDSRRDNGGNMDFPTICNKARGGYYPSRIVPELLNGSSGLYVVQIGIITFGYARVICCGMPLLGTPHFFDNEAWEHAEKYHPGWRKAAVHARFAGKFKSMSGWTRDLLGAPDREWLSQA